MMENGVEDNKPTIVKEEEEVIKTADGGVSVLNMVDNVVQVFHPKEEEEEENEQVGSEPPKPPTISEHEQENGDDKTKTTEGAISQLKLTDKVVHVFHPDDVTKDSEQEQVEEEEADDVFEEAMTDHKPHSQDQQLLPHSPDKSGPLHHTNGDFHDSLEVKGKPCQVHDTVMFEEAVDSDLPSEDQDHLVVGNVKTAGVAAVDPVVDGVRLADGLVDDMQLLPEELVNGVVCNRKEDEDGNDVESRTSCDAAVRGDSGNGDDGVMTLDDQETSKELLLEESPDGVVCNEEGENRAAFANGEANPSTDAELESNGSCEVHDKSCNGGLIKSTVLAKYTDVGNTISDDTAPSGGVETAEQIRSQNNEGISGSFVAAVLGKTGNVGLEKLDSEEKPTHNFFSDFDKASSDVIALSERDGYGESSENIQSDYDDQKSEMRHTVAKEDTFVNEEAAEIENVSNNLGASVDEGTDRNRCHSDTIIDKRVGGDASELREKESQNVGAQRRSEGNEELSVKHPVVGEPKSPEIQDEHEKKGSTLVGDSGSARVPEIQPAVEPVQGTPHRPAGLGGAASLFEHTPRALQQTRVNGAAPQRPAQLVEDPMNGEAEENDETREKLQMIRVKFLRLAHRLGQTPHNVVVAQVLYRLGLAEQLRGRNAGRAGAFSFDRASAMAEQLESAGQEALDFSCTIMVLGKTGVGKSATINSIFDEIKFSTDAFQMGTKKVQDVVGTVQGIKVRVIDTPGLLPCWSDQRQNEKILHSVKRFIKKSPPDIVLYLDRLDMQSRDFGDLPLLRTITEIFGPSIWFNAIVVLTHAASAPPDGPNGISSSYEMFVTQRSHVVQQAIRQAAGDMRLMNPVSLVENHSACRTNRAGQRVLPNGQVWKPHLLLLSFASKILAEANTLLKLQDNPPGKPFATRPRVPPLPFLLSSLLQSRPQLKLPEEQFGDEDDLDDELDESSDSDDELEFDELPPFKRLMKAQLAKLSKAQKKAYFDELEYREKLFMKKQLREEKKRRKLLKKMAGSEKEIPNDYPDNAEEESGGGGASLPVAMPDFSLPASFDSDNPSHRYRFLDTSNPWLVRPVLETHGWDHDVGYEGINVERLFVVKDKIPVSFSGQATKDKKESNLQMEVASSIKHNEGKATSVGFDMQTIGKDMSYTLRSETRFSSFRRNKTAAGLSVTLLGDALTAGVKLEDRLIVNKRFRLVMTGGAMTGRGDVAYGGSLEATLRDKDYPLGRTSSTLGLSIMDWHGDLAIGCNVQSQIPIGRSSNLIARANLNNRGSGQVSIRLNSSEQLQIALVGLLPLLRKGVSLYQQTLHGE